MHGDYFWKSEDYHHYQAKDRFSLLVLAPGEIYFEDFSVFYYPVGVSEDEAYKRKQKGRLKLCSRSLVFDPLDTSYPMLKLLFRDIVHIGKWNGSLLSRLDCKGDVIVVESKLCINMKESGIISPYKYVREKKKHLFSLNFGNLSTTLPMIEQLRRASTLNPHDEASMIATIVQSRQARINFNTSWIEDLYEKIVLEVTADKITPLVCNPGKVLLTSMRLYFQPFNNVEPLPVIKLKLSEIERVIKRRYLLRHVGLEISTSEAAKHLYLVFVSKEARDNFYDSLMSQEVVSLEESGQENMTLKWQSGAISNYEYILYLNSQADRSFNDLTQYPVFPWIISDYTSEKLDLDNPNSFRDLKKPIGAIDETRLDQLRTRSRSMPDPKFLYGSHYSTPGFVLYYLVRVAPEYMLCLQNGKFDKPDRLFNNIESCWSNCCTGHSDFKECIPEFYNSDGDFLENKLNLNLGTKQDGTRVHDVILPPWAEGAKDFINKCRDALECPYVSENIHHWIDLIFGYKQQGEEAWKANNVFYYLTYEGAVDLDKITNPNERDSLKQQILEFGQTPKQLFTHPHPTRKARSIPQSISLDEKHNNKDEKLISNDIPVLEIKLDELVSPQIKIEKNSWCGLQNLQVRSSFKSHKDAVMDIAIFEKENQFLTVSQDTLLKMNRLDNGHQIRSSSLSNMALSSCLIMPDSDLVLIGSWDNNLYIYSIDYGRAMNKKYIHEDAITAICWKENILATASWDSTVKVWDFDPKQFVKRRSLPELKGELDHDTEVTAIDIHINSEKSLIVSGTKDGHIYIWDLETLMLESHHWIHADSVTQVIFSPDGQRILSCSEDQFMKVLDMDTGLEIYSKDSGQSIRCSTSDGQLVLAGVESGEVFLVDLVKMDCVQKFKLSDKPIRSIVVSHDSKTVLAGGEDGYVYILTSGTN